MTCPFLKLFNLAFYSIWPWSIWLQLFWLRCSIVELLISLDHFLGIARNTSWWDNVLCKQQQQGLMYFTSGCHWESSSPSKVCDMYLCTSVAPSEYCTGKHFIWKHRMCQAIIAKIPIICLELSQQQRVEHSLNLFLSCGLYSLLGFLRGNVPSVSKDYLHYWWFSDCAYQLYTDLDLDWQSNCKIIIIHNISSIIS